MKRVLILPCGIIALLTILIVTCPGDADFGRWLADEHGIQCHFHEHEHKCVHPVDGKEMLVYPKSRHVVRSGIYSFYDSVYEDVAGEQFEIKAFGRAESLFYEVIERLGEVCRENARGKNRINFDHGTRRGLPMPY